MSNIALEHIRSVWKGPAITVHINGKPYSLGEGEPKATISIKDMATVARIVANPSMAFGESYMNGELVVEGDMLAIIEGFYKTGDALRDAPSAKVLQALGTLIPKKISIDEGVKNARHHYDIGNDFYKLWLDESMAYTCAYYANENDDLATAQRQKFDLVCRKARLEPGNTVVDLGCGWGGLIFHAVEHYGVTAVGVVAAKEQAAYIEEEAKRRGLEDKVSVQCSDWRQATGTYDRVLSVGMLEHVGLPQYDEFFSLVNKMLKEGGYAFVHSIGRMTPSNRTDPWINKYIFPGYYVPAPEEMAHFAAKSGLHITDIENLWQHYVKTLMHWLENYYKHQDEIITMFDEEFDRMWRLYLYGSIGSFQWGGLNLWQMVMIKNKKVPYPLQREVNVGRE